MKNRRYRIQRDFVFLTCSIFIIVVIWVALNIYETAVTSTINQTLQTQIIPIKGIFDKQAIEAIQRRIPVVPDYSTASKSGISLTPTTLPIPTIASETLTPIPTEVLLP